MSSRDLGLARRIVANLERAGAEVDVVRTTTDAPGYPELGVAPHRYVFIGAESDHDLLHRELAALRGGARVALVGPGASVASLFAFLDDARVDHLIVGDEVDRGVFVATQKLLTGDIFGIEKYLPQGTAVHRERIRDTDSRGKAIEALADFTGFGRGRHSVAGTVVDVCDELLSELSTGFGDGEAPAVSLRYASTETLFAISIRDRLGARTKAEVVAALGRGLAAKQEGHYAEGLGAAAGTAMGIVANLARGAAAEIVCTFDRLGRSALQLFGVFEHPGSDESTRIGTDNDTDGAAPAPGAK